MALDRQKILSELGSVMNQLQSADCGCMSKLFSSSSGGQGGGVVSNPHGNPQSSGGSGGFGGCGGRHGGCCHHGHGGFNCGHGGGLNAQGAGEPSCSGFMNNNPKKMYADTYNYLNQNLMQPVVKEVYNDLRDITPENTIMADGMASKLGLSQQAEQIQKGFSMQGGNAMQVGYTTHGGNPTPGQYAMQGMQQNQIGNGIGSNMQGAIQGHMNMHEHKMPGSVGYDMHDTLNGGTRMPHNQMQGSKNNEIKNQNQQQMMAGMGPNIVKLMQIDAKTKPQPGQMAGGMNQEYYGDVGLSHNPNQQMFNPTTQYMTNSNVPSGHNHNVMTTNMHQGQTNSCSGQMGNSDPATQQMAKQNYGPHTQGMKKFNEMFPGLVNGDLGFDPMAMAIEINPANRQKAAMNSIQNMMNGSKECNKPNAKNALSADPMQNVQRNTIPINQQNVLLSNQQNYEIQPQQPYQYPQQQIYPHTEPPMQPPLQANQELARLPEDATIEQTSEQRANFQYNTLGQPVNVLPAKIYQNPLEKNLPQTLSAAPATGKLRNDISRFNVKSTVSKTALITNNPLGRAPSRSQLQNIYNQYKTSQSLTHQNIGKPSKRETASEGKLCVQQSENVARLVPIERVGDTMANNEAVVNETPMKEQARQQHTGDVAVANDSKSAKGSRNGKVRNGLQDIIYTQYPSSAAWSFHG